MKNPKLALAGLAIGAAAKGIQAIKNRKQVYKTQLNN